MNLQTDHLEASGWFFFFDTGTELRLNCLQEQIILMLQAKMILFSPVLKYTANDQTIRTTNFRAGIITILEFIQCRTGLLV